MRNVGIVPRVADLVVAFSLRKNDPRSLSLFYFAKEFVLQLDTTVSYFPVSRQPIGFTSIVLVMFASRSKYVPAPEDSQPSCRIVSITRISAANPLFSRSLTSLLGSPSTHWFSPVHTFDSAACGSDESKQESMTNLACRIDQALPRAHSNRQSR